VSESVTALDARDASPVGAPELTLGAAARLAVDLVRAVTAVIIIVTAPSAGNASAVVALEVRILTGGVFC